MNKEKVLSVILSIISILIVIEILLTIGGDTAPELKTAADNASSSGLPLANLFSINGILMLIYMTGLFLIIISVIIGKIQIKNK